MTEDLDEFKRREVSEGQDTLFHHVHFPSKYIYMCVCVSHYAGYKQAIQLNVVFWDMESRNVVGNPEDEGRRFL
jgi:hypothetical protein